MKAEFKAYIPPIATAITFGMDTARVKLDIPPDCNEEAKKLVNMQGQNLMVTIEVIEP